MAQPKVSPMADWECHCGAHNPDDKKFCLACGAQRGAVAQSTKPSLENVAAEHVDSPIISEIQETVLTPNSERTPDEIGSAQPPYFDEQQSTQNEAAAEQERQPTIKNAKQNDEPQQGKGRLIAWLIAFLAVLSLAGGAGWWFTQQTEANSGAASVPAVVLATPTPTAQATPTAAPTTIPTSTPIVSATPEPSVEVAPVVVATTTPAMTTPKVTRSPKPLRTPKPTKTPKVTEAPVEKTVPETRIEANKPQDVCANLGALATQQCRSCQGKTGFNKTLCFETTKVQYCFNTGNAGPECKQSEQSIQNGQQRRP
ncbi:MAG: hypothetical protein ACRC01_04170 [Deefgea sp.]